MDRVKAVLAFLSSVQRPNSKRCPHGTSQQAYEAVGHVGHAYKGTRVLLEHEVDEEVPGAFSSVQG